MNLLALFSHQPAARDNEPGEALARLLAEARDDDELRRQLLFLLRVPRLQRESLINTALHEMTLRGEPAALRSAFAILLSDDGARTALSVLES